MSDLPARWQRAIGLTVIQGPRPGLPLHLRRVWCTRTFFMFHTLVLTCTTVWDYVQMRPFRAFLREGHCLICLLWALVVVRTPGVSTAYARSVRTELTHEQLVRTDQSEARPGMDDA